MIVIKVGGNELDQPAFVRALAALVSGMPDPPLIVHGGGRGTTALMEAFGIEPRFIDGLRVTDGATLSAAIMGMVGEASTQLVGALVNAGLPALGLSGVDAALVRATPMAHRDGALGAVGRPESVDGDALRALLNAGFLPCLAPICWGAEGPLNVNADQVAGAVAAALRADLLVLLTNVAAVRIDGRARAALTTAEIEPAIAGGSIRDGMIPKCRGARQALEQGVGQVLICDLDGLHATLRGEVAGTTMTLAPADVTTSLTHKDGQRS